MKGKILDFRCPVDNTMFTKEYVQSISESKCRKCKNFVYFIQGTTLIEDNNNYFKGED